MVRTNTKRAFRLFKVIYRSILSSLVSVTANVCLTRLAVKEYRVLSPYQMNTPYVEGNMTDMNKLWADLFPRKRRHTFVPSQGFQLTNN